MGHVHESPPVMLAPLVVLAAGALFAGALFYEPFVAGAEGETAHDVVPHEVAVEHEVESPVFEGDAEHSTWNRHDFWGAALHVRPENDTLEAAHHVPEWVKLLPLFVAAAGIALAYALYLWIPSVPKKISSAFSFVYTLFFRKWFFDEIYDAVFVRNAVRLGRVFWRADKNVVDRLGADGFAARSVGFAAWLSRIQSGYIFQYAFVMMIAVIGILSWYFFRINGGF
jgi:NADH-quinone oxidoreductase subunit L